MDTLWLIQASVGCVCVCVCVRARYHMAVLAVSEKAVVQGQIKHHENIIWMIHQLSKFRFNMKLYTKTFNDSPVSLEWN